MKKTINLLGTGLAFGFVVALQSGCAGTATVTQPAAKPETIPLSAVKPAVVQETLVLSGKVVETMSAKGYTYVNIEKDGHNSWAAIPLTMVKVGQEIEVLPGTQMGKFTSKSLNRTFDSIIFSAGLVTEAKDAKSTLPAGHPSMGGKAQVGQGMSVPDAKVQPGHTGMMAQPVKEPVGLSGKVVETMDSGGYTYVCIENGGKKTWAAVPTTKVSVGQELKLLSGPVMTNFSSKTLNKTFDSVIFSSGVLPAAK